MRSLFEAEQVQQRSMLDPEVQRLILDLKTEYPPMRDNEVATICHVRFGRRTHGAAGARIQGYFF